MFLNRRREAHWSGFRLRPLWIEFWRDRPFRLHDRIRFARDTASGMLGESDWRKERLFP